MTLSCVVKGQPLPEVSWSDGKIVFSSTERTNVSEIFAKSNHTVVYLDNTGYQPHDKLKDQYHSTISSLGYGYLKLETTFKDRNIFAPNVFKCITKNAYGNDERDIKIELKNFIRFADGKSLEIRQTVELNDRLDFECDIEGDPRPTIRWSLVSFISNSFTIVYY